METTVLRESQVFVYPEGHWPSKTDWLSELFLNIKRVPESSRDVMCKYWGLVSGSILSSSTDYRNIGAIQRSEYTELVNKNTI